MTRTCKGSVAGYDVRYDVHEDTDHHELVVNHALVRRLGARHGDRILVTKGRQRILGTLQLTGILQRGGHGELLEAGVGRMLLPPLIALDGPLDEKGSAAVRLRRLRRRR